MAQRLVTINGQTVSLPAGATFCDAVKNMEHDTGPASVFRQAPRAPLGAWMHNRVHSLLDTIPGDGEIRFLDMTSEEGARIYARSASCLLVRAVRELFPGARVLIDNSLNRSLYCEITAERQLLPSDLAVIERRMREIVAADELFEPLHLDADAARALLLADDRPDAAALVGSEGMPCVRFGWMTDAYYGALLPSAGYLEMFALRYHVPGLLLLLPSVHSPDALAPWVELPKLSAVFHQTARWERSIGVSRMADLNARIDEGRARELVRVCEARQDKLIAGIADTIRREKRRVVLIAGPSSSGKTTFANRLLVHLKTAGLLPLALSLDDYYLDRDLVPFEADGTQDLERVETLDIALFEEQLQALLCGEAVALPRFNFITAKPEFSDVRTALLPGQPLVIEGIHGLSDVLTGAIPAQLKYRIFVSALSQMNIDDHNRVSTTDFRLLRRIVRDVHARGHAAADTIGMWPMVHRGEHSYIFPNQENADVMFNSAMPYELAALRDRAMEHLLAIPEDHPSRGEAERLMAFLRLVRPLPCEDEIPPTSIVREFIGGNTFYI